METFWQGVNKTIIKYQLLYFLKEQFSKNITEVTNTKNAEGLSGADKLEMNLSKIDEGKCVMAELNTYYTTQRIMEDLDIPISDVTRTGASFIPSPTNTTFPWLFSLIFSTKAILSCGSKEW